MYKNKSHGLAFLLTTFLLTTFFLFAGTQFDWLARAKKRMDHQDITLSFSIDFEDDEPELLFEVGLPSGKYKAAPLGPALLTVKAFQNLIHPFSLCENLKSRSPPTRLSA